MISTDSCNEGMLYMLNYDVATLVLFSEGPLFIHIS